MSESHTKTRDDFILPLSVVSQLDLARLVSEAEQVDSELTAISARTKAGVHDQPEPVMSQQLVDFLAHNEGEFDNAQRRRQLITGLRQLKDKAPVIHMTFAVAADQESLQQLTGWVRTTVHPQAVIAVGLQPALIAGVYVRTPNKVHDFSLRAMFTGGHDVLVKELETLRG